MEKGERDLRARTLEFALRIIRASEALPRSRTGDVLGKQVLRSGTSVGANYREADQARSRAEFIAKCGDCLKELDETCYWLELLVRTELLPAKKLAPLLQEAGELKAIFISILKKAKA